jgi:hypothetical protein
VGVRGTCFVFLFPHAQFILHFLCRFKFLVLVDLYAICSDGFNSIRVIYTYIFVLRKFVTLLKVLFFLILLVTFNIFMLH